MEFHISRQARDLYQFNQTLFSLRGNVIFPNFQAARLFAQKINQKKDLASQPERAVQAGDLNAMGLIDEILHVVIATYRQQVNPQALGMALSWLRERVGEQEVTHALVEFGADFPPTAVYRGEMSLAEYMVGVTDGLPNEQVLLEELLMLWLDNKNPAFLLRDELFDDTHLSAESAYSRIIAELYRFFDTQPPFGTDRQNLIDLLRAPAVKYPHSLLAQLNYIRERWEPFLEGRFFELLRRLMAGAGLIQEEQTERGFFGPGPVEMPKYPPAGTELEAENFSADMDWMPRLVLIAKNSFVWLDQLSRDYGRRITYLNEIPDEELQKLASQGITGLWLIGLWERSRASARIKQMMGNPEAIASAYSLFDYRIADELGGEAAYHNLRDRAWRYGIRLASDMVPNHMGIDSPWVAEHPDWFLSLDYSPYPAYTFNGPDLSADSRVSIHLEDHYFTRSDAAVVFKLYDHRNGQTRFIYHGNDGTTMPWNDTAQLNYLLPQVREAVIQTILAVARRFPIIRFDAAMTIAKLHFQRLWFPQPGTAGAIPSRAEFGMTKEEFDQLMPVEFWREVVDRVAQEAPDTLLLAEAFWLMESYFVRTLGMHRVYNSAFMNLLRNEENAKYRQIMKSTLEFDPEILKRYVNFMNNPDERTAVDQFGKGDKYFGIAIVMSTLPGLPMFGHGQIEGYSEKYGMEYKRAYWDERPDQDLVNRHQREVFPLLHRRSLFAGVENFLLYDFYSVSGAVDEDMYAYSNGTGNERALVIYNNRFSETQGWVRVSAAFSVKKDDGERALVQRTLGDGLNLRNQPGVYTLFRDSITGLEYIRSSQELVSQGMFLSLHAYQYYVFLDFHEIHDDVSGSYRKLAEYLNGRGVPSIQYAQQELLLQPVLQPLREILHPGYLSYLQSSRLDDPEKILSAGLMGEAEEKLRRLADGIERLTGSAYERERLAQELQNGLRLALSLSSLQTEYPLPGSKKYAQAAAYFVKPPAEKSETAWVILYAWVFLRNLGILSGQADWRDISLEWFTEWLFARAMTDSARELGFEEEQAIAAASALRILIEQQDWYLDLSRLDAEEIVTAWFNESDIQQYLNVHRFEDAVYFNKERFDLYLWWMAAVAVVGTTISPKSSASLLVERLLLVDDFIKTVQNAVEKSEYQVNRLLAELKPAPAA